ncbi:hypothetical protein FN846DRAFT_912663 [Sphaerosporella brunnea]|uniref:Uncharacterized protein n=1 Tax=Sphaerosporella brunnea TaxID=1250544 RepID=A0A5J5EH85_9PEZI|nr:hypothetical protein FN846DRAFT_912663 [Sphaerosporella brunnea]
MPDKEPDVCPHHGDEGNHTRHMRWMHHMCLCARHGEYTMAKKYITKSTGLLKCGCKHRLRIGASTDWWKTLTLAKCSLAGKLADGRQAEMSAEDELVGKKANEQFRYGPDHKSPERDDSISGKRSGNDGQQGLAEQEPGAVGING